LGGLDREKVAEPKVVLARGSGEGMTGVPVLFVGGCMRSGTTLVQRLLCAAPRMGPAIAECQYLTALLAAQQRGEADFDLFMRDYFETPAEFDAFGRETLRRFLAETAARCGKPHCLVLKNPELAFHFSRLARLLPEAGFILVVRDPRDVIASILRVAERQRAAGRESHLTAMGRDMAQLSNFMLSYYADPYSHVSLLHGRLHVIRYEDAVRRDPAALEGLMRFVGRPIEGRLADLAGEGWHCQREDSYAGAFWSAGWTEGASEQSIGAYRRLLSEAEVAAIERDCGKFGRRFRYW
jgi:hypothetical protein